MKLITDKLIKRFKELGDQLQEKDPIVVIKFFNAAGAGTWYATAYDPVTKVFYGYVSIFGDYNDEWGNFSLKELETIGSSFGLGVERDLFCGEKRISEFEVSTLIKTEQV